MTLSTSDLNFLLKKAIDAALAAGQCISEFDRKDIDVQKKEGGGTLASQVVSNVDLLSQKAIENILLETCAEFDLAFLAEESASENEAKNHDRHTKNYFWAVDPIDGTLPFIENTAGYSVSIALVRRDGIPILGVVYDPREKILYYAQKGDGVYKNGKAWHPNKNANNALTLTMDRSFKQSEHYDQVVKTLTDISHQNNFSGINIIDSGGAVMNALWVLEHAPGCYFKYPKHSAGGGSIWDFAATACIFNEVGACVSDIHGNALDLNRSDSLFMNHRGVLYASDQDVFGYVKSIYNKESDI